MYSSWLRTLRRIAEYASRRTEYIAEVHREVGNRTRLLAGETADTDSYHLPSPSGSLHYRLGYVEHPLALDITVGQRLPRLYPHKLIGRVWCLRKAGFEFNTAHHLRL